MYVASKIAKSLLKPPFLGVKVVQGHQGARWPSGQSVGLRSTSPEREVLGSIPGRTPQNCQASGQSRGHVSSGLTKKNTID